MKKTNKNYQKGQVTVEYILLAVIVIVAFQATTQALERWELLKEFQETPGKVFKSMVENGNLIPNEEKSRQQHPNHHASQYTPDGKGP